MHLLFITHSGNLTYGAAKSLGLLLKTIGCEFDIIFDKHILINTTYKDIQEYVGEKCRHIYFESLPLYYLPMKDIRIWRKNYSFIRNLKEIGSLAYRQIQYYYGYKSIHKIINDEQYDYVILNSIILYPLIEKEIKCILYLREMLKDNLSVFVTRKINMSHGMISIDYPVQESLYLNHKVNRQIPNRVITNPFDMETVNHVNSEIIRKKYHISHDTLVLTMAGVFSPMKGLEFVLESFNKCDRRDAVLIIAGGGEEASSIALKRKYSSNQNIRFVGTINHMEEIYSITDYVVRGESEFCTGRTVYEALYAGCGVMIQGHSADIYKMDLIDDQVSRIHFYEPRNMDSFCDILKQLPKVEKNNNTYSNLDIFRQEFHAFITEI